MRLFGSVVLLAGCNPDGVTLGGDGTVSPDSLVWSDTVVLDGSQQIGAADAVVAQAGTTVQVSPGARLIVLGTFTAEGTAEAPVRFEAPAGWGGIDLQGTLEGTYLQLLGPGGQLSMSGTAVLDLVDSEIDLMNPGGSPDCTSVNGGEITLDHVRIHGCHCPLHINHAGATVITNSVLDEDATQMIANLTATFTGNDITGGIQDVGGGITADVSGNYWGGGAPSLQTGDPSQFTGVDDWSDTPIPGAGPR